MNLTVQKRDPGRKAADKLRSEGLIPAELYGHGSENAHLAVHARDFARVFKQAGENMVITLEVGEDKRPAVVHDVQTDYLTGEIKHVDFYQVRLDEKIKAKVPIDFTGEAPAVKSAGGILMKILSEIEVESLPSDLPHRLHADLGGLDSVSKSLYVRDLAVPRGVKIMISPETVIATVAEPRKEEEIAAAPPVDVSAVKVETEEKKAEREAEKTRKIKPEDPASKQKG